MRDFGKVYSTFWTSETTRNLSDRARLLAVYLLSGPHTNMLGCFRLPDGYVIEDLRWNQQTVSKGFAELFRKGFATRDEGSKWVLVRRFLRWNPIENPNQGKSVARLFEQIPNELALKSELANILEQCGDKFPQTVLERFRNGSPTVPETVSKPGEGEGEGEGAEDGEGIAAKPRAVRPRDLLWDAIVEVTGADASIKSVASHIGKVKRALLEASPAYTPEEVLALPAAAAVHLPWSAGRVLTLGEVEKNIGLVRTSAKPVSKSGGKADLTHRIITSTQTFLDKGAARDS